MARVLTMREKTVAPSERDAYLQDVQRQRASAGALNVHFWVFENHDEPGRFVEFTEGADATAIAQWHGGELNTPLWREVQGL